MSGEILFDIKADDVRLQIYDQPDDTLAVWISVGVAALKVKPEQMELVVEAILAADEFMEGYNEQRA